MAKFSFNGYVGFGFGASSTNSKKGWMQKLVAKIGGKTTQQSTEQQPETKATEEAAGGLGGCGLQYSASIELSIEEMKEFYALSHSDEEWNFGRTAAEIKAIGKGIKDLADKFVADNGNSIKAVFHTACDVYESCKRRDHDTSRVDREIELDEYINHLDMEREMDRLLREDQRIREADKKAEEEKAKQKK